MKIGAFAKKFDLNISAIRFYINNGLLIPSKNNGQYEFGKECITDMENIIKYKKYRFTLEEIQLLFFMEKASKFQDEIVLEVCAEILKKKKGELEREKDNLTEFIDDIQKEIDFLFLCEQKPDGGSGIPFSFIPYLYCPHCQKPLKLDNASISNGTIHKGELTCDCHYKATISEGIILCDDYSNETPFKAFNNVESVRSMKDQFSPTYRMLIKKANIWMYNHMSKIQGEGRHVMAGPFTLNFIFEYVEKLGNGNTYIICDPSLDRIKKIKKYLGVRGYRMVYIVGKPGNLPLKQESVDLYIDDYSTVNSLFTYNDFLVPQLAPLLKKGGEVVGIFTTYQKAPESLKNFRQLHPNFEISKMTLKGLLNQWAREGVALTEQKSVGFTSLNEIHFKQNKLGEQVEVYGYSAKKTQKNSANRIKDPKPDAV